MVVARSWPISCVVRCEWCQRYKALHVRALQSTFLRHVRGCDFELELPAINCWAAIVEGGDVTLHSSSALER